MALKPIPRLILIVAAVGALGYGASKYLNRDPQAVQPTGNTAATPAGTVAPAQEATPAAVGNGTAYQTIVDKGVVRVSVQSPSKPFFYTEKGVAKGFNVAFMKLLFAQSEFTKQHKQIVIDTDNTVDTYPKVPEALLKKDNRGNAVVDIAIDGLTFADSDLNGVVYSVPYVDDFGYSLIASSRSSIRSVEDTKGLTIGILEGDPDVEAYVKRNMPGAKFVALSDASVNGQRTWINNAIKAGKVDAIVYDYPFAVAEIAGTDLQFALTKLPDSDIKYKIAVRKEDSQLLENINIAIRKVKEDPQYPEMIKKYFLSTNVAAVRAAGGSETTYVVKRGDTLGGIAAALLGDKNRYVAIQARNNLANPNLIQVGQGLVIPK
jgi:ABC-type amino acid transport substrate-binding protein